MFTEEITYNLPFTLADAEVIDSAVVSPHNSFLKQDIEEYSLTVTFANSRYVDEIEALFRTHAHPHLKHVGEWKHDKFSITATSLVKPRLPKGTVDEFKLGDQVQVRVRVELKEGEEAAIERVLIVGFLMNDTAEEPDWDSMETQYDW